MKDFTFLHSENDEFGKENREFYSDAYDTEGGVQNWMRYRLFAFLQRPNAEFRALIRSLSQNTYILKSEKEHHVKNGSTLFPSPLSGISHHIPAIYLP